MELRPNILFHNRYRLIEKKGSGSFGEVWLAHDEQTGIEVAVKIYIALDDRGVEEFRSEFKTAYALNHPHLLHANFFDVCERRPYLVMQYCPSSAVSLIGQIDEQTAWEFIRDVANGVDYLHEQDVIHRDIKPDNILRDSGGRFLITDFGLSMRMRSTLRRNSTRQKNADNVAGTIGYMAPELFAARAEAVKATDIWALGATLYEMLTGELPFMGQGGVMQLHGAEIPALKGEYSQDLKDTISACLAKDTWERPTAVILTRYVKLIQNENDMFKSKTVFTEKTEYSSGQSTKNKLSRDNSTGKNLNQSATTAMSKTNRWFLIPILSLPVLLTFAMCFRFYNDIHIFSNKQSESINNEQKLLIDKVYKIGDYYSQKGKEGVVFFVDSTGTHGKIISLIQGDEFWCTNKVYNQKTNAINDNDGRYNYNQIQAFSDWQIKFPAFEWCNRIGHDWYLPSRNEIRQFLKNDSIRNKLNEMLLKINSTPLYNREDGQRYYWSSTEMEGNKEAACAVSAGYRDEWFSKICHCYVRAVSEF